MCCHSCGEINRYHGPFAKTELLVKTDKCTMANLALLPWIVAFVVDILIVLRLSTILASPKHRNYYVFANPMCIRWVS